MGSEMCIRDSIKTSGSPTTTVSSTQAEVTIRWDNSSLSGHHYYKLYYKAATSADSTYNIVTTDNSTYDGVITIDNESSDSYVHSSLTEGAYYHYKLTANTIAGGTSDTTLGGDGTYHTTQIYSVANSVTVTHSNGSTTVNEAGYGQGFYDWSELSSGNTINYAVTRDAIGNLYVAGGQSGNNASITKYNSVGTQQWISTVGSTPISEIKDVVVDSSGNSYLITGDSDIFVSKFNSSGTNQWTKTFTSPSGSDGPRSAEILNDVIYINAVTNGTWATQSKTGNFDSLVLILDTDGNQTSVKQTGGSSPALLIPSSLAVDSNGNYYQAGLTEGDVDGLSHSHKSAPGYCTNWSSHPHDLFIRKYNSSHVRQWTKLFNSLNGFSYAGGDGVYWFNNARIGERR